MDINRVLRRKIVVLDGAMGTALIAKGYKKKAPKPVGVKKPKWSSSKKKKLSIKKKSGKVKAKKGGRVTITAKKGKHNENHKQTGFCHKNLRESLFRL